jgi:hypothetical protein
MRRARTLVLDVAAVVAVAWTWHAIYESFTRTGLWCVLARALGGATTLPSELVVLAACMLAGWLPLAVGCALVVSRALRPGRPALPVARVVR